MRLERARRQQHRGDRRDELAEFLPAEQIHFPGRRRFRRRGLGEGENTDHNQRYEYQRKFFHLFGLLANPYLKTFSQVSKAAGPGDLQSLSGKAVDLHG